MYACLRAAGTYPVDNELLMIRVMKGVSRLEQSFSNHVEIGSVAHCFNGAELMNYSLVCTELWII